MPKLAAVAALLCAGGSGCAGGSSGSGGQVQQQPQPRQPPSAPFSWDTPPVFIHCALPNGFTSAQAVFMATRPLVTLEKFICQQCGPHCSQPPCVNNSHAEAKLTAAAEQIHAHNASARILAYFPGWLAHPWYVLTATVNATVRHGFVTTDRGTPTGCGRGRHSPCPAGAIAGADGAWIFNWSNPLVRGLYVKAVLGVLASPAVSGIFVDGTPQDLEYCEHAPRGGPRTCFNSTSAWNSTGDGVCPGCSAQRIAALQAGQLALWSELRAALAPIRKDAIVICNPVTWLGAEPSSYFLLSW